MSAIAKILDAVPRYAGLLCSQYWPPERLLRYRKEQLGRVLVSAARIPFYAKRLGADLRWEDFASLPILMRSDVASLVASVRSLYPVQTAFTHATSSGTSGPRAEFLFDRSHQRGRNAARARYLRSNGWNPIRRSVWLAGEGFLSPGTATDEYEDRQFISRALIGVKFLSITQDFFRLASEISTIDPLYIYAYPSVIDGILKIVEENSLHLPSLRRVFSGAEVLEDSIRARAQRILGVGISENYGSTEAFLAWQCPAGNYHQNAEHAFIELVDESGREVPPGQMGRVILTTLENHLMPLIRYEIGDYAMSKSGTCPCGRTLPLIGRVAGRGMNLFRNSEGKRLAAWDFVNVLLEIRSIQMFQIVQTELQHMVVRYVADGLLPSETKERVRGAFSSFLGTDVLIDFQRTFEIPRTSSGKFMVTLSDLEDVGGSKRYC